LLSEVKNSPKNEAPAGGGRGVPWAGAFELAEQIKFGLFTLRRWEKCACSLLLPHHRQADIP
jgi:hypothetical protein